MTQEQYYKVLPFVWVCKFKKDVNKIVDYSLTYRFSKEVPKPVPNTQMVWQKPLYDELRCINKRMMSKARKRIYENRSIF